MTLVVRRALLVLLAIDALAFVVAYSERHATHGAAESIGAVAWFGFLLGVLLTVIAGAVALVQIVVRRQRRLSA